MTTKDKIESAVIGGLTGLVVVAVFLVARAYAGGAEAGDWLNFAGVIFGVMLTVFCTVGVERLRGRLAQRQEIEETHQAIEAMLETLNEAEERPRIRQRSGDTLTHNARLLLHQFTRVRHIDRYVAKVAADFEAQWAKDEPAIVAALAVGDFPQEARAMLESLELAQQYMPD